VLCFTCDEVWEHLPGAGGESVHLSDWPAACPERLDAALAADFQALLAVRDRVKRAQEAFNADKAKADKVNPLEMQVVLAAAGDELALLERYASELRALFVVSAVVVSAGDGELAVTVSRAAGRRCARSWRVFSEAEFGQVAGHPEVSNRDGEVVEWLKAEGRLS